MLELLLIMLRATVLLSQSLLHTVVVQLILVASPTLLSYRNSERLRERAIESFRVIAGHKIKTGSKILEDEFHN